MCKVMVNKSFSLSVLRYFGKLKKIFQKGSNKFFSTWHQDFQCNGECWCRLEVDAEDGLVTVKVTTIKLVFLGNYWSPQQTFSSPTFFKTNLKEIFKVN